MIRKALLALLLLYVGILVGEIPVGNSTVGRTAWNQTRNCLEWGGSQTQRLVTYAGFGDSALMKWLDKSATSPKAKPRQAPKMQTDEEGLTPLDKEALRRMLE